MNCREIQQSLFGWCVHKRHVLVLPNFYLGYECDLVSVTNAKMTYEYEIKISLQDFKADAKKAEKHGVYRGEFPHTRHAFCVPNHFLYVVPEELRTAVEPLIPQHAGLIVARTYGLPLVLRKAPKLHTDPMPEQVFMRAAKSLMFRYWAMRNAKTEATLSRKTLAEPLQRF